MTLARIDWRAPSARRPALVLARVRRGCVGTSALAARRRRRTCTVLTTRGGRRDPHRGPHLGRLSDEDVGHRLRASRSPALARTVADCLTALSPLGALVVADAALHSGAAGRGRLRLRVARAGRRNGCVRARTLLALADDGAESPAETGTRFVLLRDGFPVPNDPDRGRDEAGVVLGRPRPRGVAAAAGVRRPREVRRRTRRSVLPRRRSGTDAVVETGLGSCLRVTASDLRGYQLSRRLTPLLPASPTQTFTPRPRADALIDSPRSSVRLDTSEVSEPTAMLANRAALAGQPVRRRVRRVRLRATTRVTTDQDARAGAGPCARRPSRRASG